MKKSIIEALATKFSGADEKTLDRIATKLAKTVETEEDVATAVQGVTIQQVLDSYGDYRANEAAKTAVANYEREYQLKKGVKVTDGGVEEPKQKPAITAKNADDIPAWAQALLDDNKALKEQISAMQGEKVANTRHAALAKVLENAPDKLKGRYEKDFSRLQFRDDEDFNEWLEETKSDIVAIGNQLVTAGGIVSKPKAGGGKAPEAVNPIVKARIEAKTNEPATTAIAGLQQTIK